MIVKAESYHIPVMLEDSVDGLDIHTGVYIDTTFGGGGHSREILHRMPQDAHLYSFDQDKDAERNIIDDSRFTFVRSNFRYLKNWMMYYGIEAVDGILADLGVSSHHFDDETRGFSFRFDAPLDMRMNQRAGKSAAEILKEYDEQQLAQMFNLYGELKDSRRIARKIVAAREQTEILTTTQLIETVWGDIPSKKEAAQLFQALRIEVNHEMDALKEMLLASVEMLKPGGRLVVITYHSLEDRMVKNIMKAGNIDGKVEQDFFGRKHTPLKEVGKMQVPTIEEIERNPRSRSAKLRIAVKL